MPTVLFTSALQRFLPVPSAHVTAATMAEALAGVFVSEPRLRDYVVIPGGCRGAAATDYSGALCPGFTLNRPTLLQRS